VPINNQEDSVDLPALLDAESKMEAVDHYQKKWGGYNSRPFFPYSLVFDFLKPYA